MAKPKQAKQKHRQNSWVWYKGRSLGSSWGRGQIESFDPDYNIYTIKVKWGSSTLKVKAHDSEVKQFKTGKYSPGQKVRFTHPEMPGTHSGTISRPVSPSCNEYYVDRDGDSERRMIVRKKDIHR